MNVPTKRDHVDEFELSLAAVALLGIAIACFLSFFFIDVNPIMEIELIGIGSIAFFVTALVDHIRGDHDRFVNNLTISIVVPLITAIRYFFS